MSSASSVSFAAARFSMILAGCAVFGMTAAPRYRANAMHTCMCLRVGMYVCVEEGGETEV